MVNKRGTRDPLRRSFSEASEGRETRDVYAVILVGGKGKRLKPLSTDSRPKAFLSVTRNRKTMFRNTIERLKGIVPPENIFVVANKRHSHLVKADMPRISRSNLLLEPVSRNTAPAIAFAAKTIECNFGDGIMVVLPADHHILGRAKYLEALRRAIDFVKFNKEAIVTVGIKPKHPATEFGYLKVRGSGFGFRGSGPMVREVYKVERFVEKPHLSKAKVFVKSKKYLWNSGGFIFRTATILNALKKHLPAVREGLEDLADIDRIYPHLPDISIDYAVMENADNIYCVKARHDWYDIGTFASLKRVLDSESRRYIEKRGKVIRIL